MTNTSSISSKLFVGFVAVAMLFSISFAPVQAATTTTTTTTTSDLQAQINALLAQVAALQGGTMTSSCSFTMNLKVGSRGADVTALQNFLISNGNVIAAGATGYFGGQTRAALAHFQSAKGIAPAVGYFGPITRASVNAMCTSSGSTTTTTTTGGTTGGTTTGGTSATLNGGEATLSQYQLRTGNNTSLQEGIKDAPVAVAEFKVKQGDLKVTRADVTFLAAGTNAVKNPWEVFSTVAIMVDGDKVGTIDASMESNWTKTATNEYRIRITGMNSVVRMDKLIDMTVAVSVQAGTDIVIGNTDNWTLKLGNVSDGNNAIRGTDAAGVDQYIGDSSKTVPFTVGKKGTDDQLNIKSSSANPESTTLKANVNSTSDWITILAYTLDTKNSINDIGVRSLPISVNVPGATSTYNNVVNNARLMVGSQTYSADTVTGGGNATATLTFNFDKGVWLIKAGQTADVKFQVKLNRIANTGALYNPGQTIIASTTDADFMTAEGAKTLTSSQTSGSAQGKTHTIRTQGIILAKNSVSGTVTTDPVTSSLNKGNFTVKFDVTAFENDVWVPMIATSAVAFTNTAGAQYQILDNANVVQSATSTQVSAALTSTASIDGSYFKLNQGETKTFTLSVTFDPATAGYYRVGLVGVNFATTNGVATDQQVALPASDFKTDPLNI